MNVTHIYWPWPSVEIFFVNSSLLLLLILLIFLVNLNDVGPTTTLNTFLREIAHLKGTKKMCEEGGCGACTVAVEKTVDGQKQVFSVNSVCKKLISY